MNDLKFAFRQLLKNPGFTAVAVLTLALGITGCSRDENGNRAVFVDGQGRETTLTSGLNAGITNASGNSTAIVRVRYPDESAASRLPYRLELPTPSTNVVAAAGTLSAEGEATIRDLAGGNPSVVYYLYVEGQSAGVVFVDSNRATNRSEFLLPAKAGMKAPDLALVDLSSGRKFRLSDLRGQVVFIEFYTTHCAPCQPVLARLNEFVERRGEGLNGKAAILAVGLDAVLQPDSSPETVAKHLRRKKWTRLRPLVPDQAFSWEVTKRSPFGVNGVPQSFLIDREGAILWSGHPGEVNVEQKIDELLKLGAE